MCGQTGLVFFVNGYQQKGERYNCDRSGNHSETLPLPYFTFGSVGFHRIDYEILNPM